MYTADDDDAVLLLVALLAGIVARQLLDDAVRAVDELIRTGTRSSPSCVVADAQRIVIDARSDRAAFEKQHLRGARFVDWDAWDVKLDKSYAAVDPEWTAMLSTLGIRHDSLILIYDDGRMSWSAMIWIALARLGARDIHIVSTRASTFLPTLAPELIESGPPRAVKPSHEKWSLVGDGAPNVIGKGEVQSMIAKTAPLLAFVRGLIEHAAEHSQLFRAIIGKRAGHAIEKRFRQTVIALVKDDLAGHGFAGRALDVTTYYVAGARVELLTWWIDTRNSLPPAEVEVMFRRLTMPVLAASRSIDTA